VLFEIIDKHNIWGGGEDKVVVVVVVVGMDKPLDRRIKILISSSIMGKLCVDGPQSLVEQINPRSNSGCIILRAVQLLATMMTKFELGGDCIDM